MVKTDKFITLQPVDLNMGEYDKVRAALNTYNLNWHDIDRILLNEAAYEDFQERSDSRSSNHRTTDDPAVRQTDGPEKIVYVDKQGYQQEILL